MRTFEQIFQISAERHGGAAALEERLDKPKPAAELAALGDDRWLAGMTRSVFQAGFNWKVIQSMWPGFETAFRGFDVNQCAMMDDDWFDRLVSDRSIVRHAAKIKSVQANAAFLRDLSAERGEPAGAIFANWPEDDFIGLLDLLKKRGSRLGGMTGPYFLRQIGRDSFILSRDVTARLIAEGVVDKAPTGKAAQKAVQAAFSQWRAESGRSLTEISRVLGLSIG